MLVRLAIAAVLTRPMTLMSLIAHTASCAAQLPEAMPGPEAMK